MKKFSDDALPSFEVIKIGEEHRSSHSLEISGANWSHFNNGVIQGAGIARFSSGRADLLLADGNIYFYLTLLAPGLIQQPITMWDGLYLFRRVQQLLPLKMNLIKAH